MSETIINKVAGSGLITLDLEKYLPQAELTTFDLKDHLFMGLILKEKDFREALKNTDWNAYSGQYVAITCTADAVIPMWAYMLVASYLQPVAAGLFVGSEAEFRKFLLLQHIEALDISGYADQRIVVKGCGDNPIDAAAYAAITRRLRPVVKSIMYGEPCSTVPIYKNK